MEDAGRWFLLAFAAVPLIPSCKDDEPSLEERCLDAFSAYFRCYGEYTQQEIQAYAQEYCDYIVEYYGQYGDGCAEAAVEIFACLSSLDCGTDPGDSDACRKAYGTAHELCPELYGLCPIIGVSGGGNTCGRSGEECIDGKTYAVNCTEANGALDCECTIDGASVGTYAVATTCDSYDFTGPAEAECGFPPGTP